jgi:hypothetical protein
MKRKRNYLPMIIFFGLGFVLGGCGSDTPAGSTGIPAKLSEPNIPKIPQAK